MRHLKRTSSAAREDGTPPGPGHPVAEPEAGGGADGTSRRAARLQRGVAVLLALMVGVVVFWEIAANMSRQQAGPFALSARDLESFVPSGRPWSVRSLPIAPRPEEPNIAAFLLTPPDGEGGVLVRLVHGYNMHDCMRLKGYRVELLRADHGQAGAGATSPAPPPGQVWRLTSAIGDVAIWATSMLRVDDFRPADVDARSLPFPRLAAGDDTRWSPQGLTWSSLRHPVSNLQLFLRRKWSDARCDWPTFLGLRQPAGASDALLTLVAEWRGSPLKPDGEAAVERAVLEARDLVLRDLLAWRRAHPPVPARTGAENSLRRE